MKKLLHLTGLLLGCFLIAGMGGLGGTPANRVPTPEKDFSATFTDKQDVETVCTQISREGEVFLLGKKGEGIVTVSFEKIRAVKFKDGGDTVTAMIELTDGKTIEIEVDKRQRFFGKVDFGTFKIEVNSLKTVTFNQ